VSWLTVNGIELARVAALGSPPAGARRDIGGTHEAADGSLVITRQARKNDLSFETVPRSGAEAYAWEQLLTGAGHVWSFDSHFYSSKGLAPSAISNSVVTTADPVYGVGSCEQTAVTGYVSYAALAAGATKWTVMVWRKVGFGAWTHYVVTSASKAAGQAYVGGVLSVDATAWLTVTTSTGTVKVDAGVSTTWIDDMVICPYVWLDDWPAQVFAADAPFGPTPFLVAAGDLVREAATRRMLCEKCDEKVLKANLGDGDGMTSDLRTLGVELKEV
jgi:hypothetical protein